MSFHIPREGPVALPSLENGEDGLDFELDDEIYEEAPSMTLRDLLLQADPTQFDLLGKLYNNMLLQTFLQGLLKDHVGDTEEDEDDESFLWE
jgi:hypothetical protein